MRTVTGRSSPSRRAALQRFRLVFEVEPVAGLDLDRGDAFGDQRVEARQRLRDEIVLARRPQRLDRRDDAAAGLRHLLIGRAGQPHLEFVGAVAGMDQMRVAVDQAGRDPAAFAVDDFGAAGRRGRHIRFRTGKDDPAVPRDDRAVLDSANAGQLFGKGRKPGIAPDARRCR